MPRGDLTPIPKYFKTGTPWALDWVARDGNVSGADLENIRTPVFCGENGAKGATGTDGLCVSLPDALGRA